jgi:hypothetical protein
VKAVGKRRAGQPAWATLHDLLWRRETIGFALVIAAILLTPWIAISGPVVRRIGVLTFALMALLVYAGWLVIRDSRRSSGRSGVRGRPG